MLNLELKNRGLNFKMMEDTEYFYVKEIKEREDLKIDVDKIVYINDEPVVKAKYVSLKTAFDRMMSKTLKNKKK